MAQISTVFAVPMIFHKMEDCAGLNQELEQLFVARAEEGEKYSNPQPIVDRNEPLFESNFRLFDWPHDCVRRLRDFCVSALYGAIGELNGYSVEQLQRLHMAVESWYHLTLRGGYFGVHNHALHSWSGVYCVRHDGDDPQSMSGRLTFLNPNAIGAMYMDMALMNMRPPFGMGPLNLRLEPGELVLFPSWVQHHVLPYDGDTRRITVAFNARFRMEGVDPRAVPLG